MTEFHKKLRHLSTTMLHWAEDNKTQRKEVDGIAGDYEIPQRNGTEWKDDFKFVTKLDSILADSLDNKLTRAEMKMCNQLYTYYGWNVYDPV
jgi:hypothetical protein